MSLARNLRNHPVTLYIWFFFVIIESQYITSWGQGNIKAVTISRKSEKRLWVFVLWHRAPFISLCVYPPNNLLIEEFSSHPPKPLSSFTARNVAWDFTHLQTLQSTVAQVAFSLWHHVQAPRFENSSCWSTARVTFKTKPLHGNRNKDSMNIVSQCVFEGTWNIFWLGSVLIGLNWSCRFLCTPLEYPGVSQPATDWEISSWEVTTDVRHLGNSLDNVGNEERKRIGLDVCSTSNSFIFVKYLLQYLYNTKSCDKQNTDLRGRN